ncbi:MAG: vitamin K epoxide reductase family protein, partial [Acidimicrobiales bacterium]|nr:vitamin K epoxide reductase family protein [Acidimicrobiales bacterium]
MSDITRRRPPPEATSRDRVGETAAPGAPFASPIPRWLPPVATAVALLGLGVSTYLTITHYAAGAVPLACPASGGINCQKVTTSPQSMIFGIPVALYGTIWFLLMVAANVGPAWRSERWWIMLGRLALAVAGIGFAVYLIYAELFLINAICLECT